MLSWLKKPKPSVLDASTLPSLIDGYVRASGLEGAPDVESRNFLSYLRHYQTQDTITSYMAIFDKLVDGRLGPKPATVLDYGCWYGLSSVMLSTLGPHVVGVDINPHALRRGRDLAASIGARHVSLDHCAAFLMAPDAYPSDMAMIMDVLCSAHPDEHPRILAAMAEAIKPSGWLFISDANNLRNAEVMVMLRQRWRDYEIGEGSLAAPRGHYFSLRKEFISSRFPELGPEKLETVTRQSCYLWGDDLTHHVRALLDGTTAPIEFDEQGSIAPMRAADGCTFGTALDPVRLLSILRGFGLHAELRSLLDGPAIAAGDEAAYDNAHYFIVARNAG
ncbi:MAG: class I SAM-dependent methyltransferase [Bosea sp. (in: a-proteobacteria)]